jgi:NADPH2 dehydrogenase
MAEQLLKPLKLGNVTLNHRVIMAPCTTYRATDGHIPGPRTKTYYAQRASVMRTLIITEATYVSDAAAGEPNVPGLWNAE